MRKIYFILIAVLPICNLTAQPVLTSNNLHTGSTFNVYAMSNVNTENLVTPGADVSWDLGSASATFMATVAFLEMSDTPYAATYPEANFAMKFTDFTGNISYSLFNLTENIMEEVANNVGTDNATTFLNYRTSLIFPFTFTSSNSDTYQKEGQETKAIDSTYDAYGTFTANGSTTTDVVRIYSEDNGNTSINWWTSNPVAPLFMGSSDGFVLWESTSTPTGILESNKNELFEIYPNPATDELHIVNIAGISKIEIYNLLGQLQLTNTSSPVDISMLESGMYILKALTGKESFSQAFIKN